MKKISDFLRAERLIYEVIEKLDLNLTSMTVLTEAASGNFIVTPLIAAIAGAEKVYAICRDSEYGTVEEIKKYLLDLMAKLKIPEEKIYCIEKKEAASIDVNIITNLGFVRPIDSSLLENLPYDAAISLMFESWEFREEDIDIRVCKSRNIPILGTKETHSSLQIFKYVGVSVLKLLLENNIEVFKSRILLVSSGRYLEAIYQILKNNEADIYVYNPYEKCDSLEELKKFSETCDAVVVAEQKNKEILIGDGKHHIDIKWLLRYRPIVIHIAGMIDYDILDSNKIIKMPSKRIPYGYMTVTTEYAGIRPVIELHAAGLKVGQALVEGLRMYNDVDKAKKYALGVSPAMPFDY